MANVSSYWLIIIQNLSKQLKGELLPSHMTLHLISWGQNLIQMLNSGKTSLNTELTKSLTIGDEWQVNN